MPATTTARRPPADLAPLFAGVLRSEARKLATVRSTTWAVLAAVAFKVIIAALLGALLGVLAVTSEYSSGMIRATLAAVPRRRLLLTAKALVLATAAVHRPPRAPHAPALDRVRRVLPVRGGCPRCRVRPDRAPRHITRRKPC
jgi:hypothetical protein